MPMCSKYPQSSKKPKDRIPQNLQQVHPHGQGGGLGSSAPRIAGLLTSNGKLSVIVLYRMSRPNSRALAKMPSSVTAADVLWGCDLVNWW
ncbi:hypothetical protein TIFTF001_033382 [Ficus carica]|uniref:Uncharacterized protein n=1 Tax=Ficus carica TaxID=3494 RepID=A0AA88DY83_FICCA|nr:hypothetical protein TIFTF001_033382 [Ficus carica]